MSRLNLYVWSRFWVVVLLSASLLGCDKFLKDSALDKTASLPAMRTHCVGRYLIDLPAEFEQLLSSDVELIYGLDKNFRKVSVKVVRETGSRPSFDQIASRRAMELAAVEHADSPSKTQLAIQKRVDGNTILVRSHYLSLVDSYNSDFFSEYGDVVGSFAARTHTEGDVEVIERGVFEVVKKTRFLKATDQAGRGTCLGPLLIDAGQDGERFSVAFRAVSRPDAFISIDMNSMLAKSDGGLLKRWDSKVGMLNKLNFESTTLRRGSVVIGGAPGEELLTKGKDHGHVILGFTAEPLQTKPATFASPSMAINMNVGGQLPSAEYADASWSDAEALAIWDRIVKSIRLRPGAV